jgi:hypothetical protein
MHGFKRYLITVALACGVAALTGSAFAAPPGGAAPGQEKKAEEAPAAAPAAAPAENAPPGQEKKAEQAPAAPAPAATPAPAGGAKADKPAKADKAAPAKADKAAPAKADKAAPAKAAPAQGAGKSADKTNGVNAGTAGVKPTNSTDKNTSCKTGGAMPSPTCTRNPPGNNPPDSSKRYGNGKTAAQIATSRSAPAGTEIRGPGNSQPHKVCGKNGHFVDVHAVKSYPNSCTATESGTVAQPQGTVTVSCPATTTLLTGVAHKTGSGVVVIHPSANSAHVSKHGDGLVTVSVTLANGATCTASVPATTSAVATQTMTQQIAAAVGQATGSTVVSTSVASQSAQSAQSARGAGATGAGVAGVSTPAGGTAAGASTPAGGVLGAQHTEGRGATGGVAGAFKTLGGVAAGTLPFTGFPLWAAVLIGLLAVALGLMLWRRSRGPVTTDAV